MTINPRNVNPRTANSKRYELSLACAAHEAQTRDMQWWQFGVLVACGIAVGGIAVAVVAGALGARRRRAAPQPMLDPRDVSELSERFAAIAADHAPVRAAAIDARLRVLRSRRVPVRAVLPAQRAGTARVRFADGTVVLVGATCRRDLFSLACGVDRDVSLASWRSAPDRTTVHFVWRAGGSADVIALGLDQAD